MKTLEAKLFDQNAENWKRENRLFTSTVLEDRPRGKIESVRTLSEVIEQFDSLSLLNLLFLVRNWHCWSRKASPRQMTPKCREKTAKTAVFWHRCKAWKVVRSIAAVRQRPRTPRNWRRSFAFSSISFVISIKNSMQRWYSDFQGLSRVKIRKMAQGSNDLSTLPLILCLSFLTFPQTFPCLGRTFQVASSLLCRM